MKHLKAYTFEELLNEIPELEKVKHNVSPASTVAPLLKFARQNKMKYCLNPITLSDNNIYFLFEKI